MGNRGSESMTVNHVTETAELKYASFKSHMNFRSANKSANKMLLQEQWISLSSRPHLCLRTVFIDHPARLVGHSWSQDSRASQSFYGWLFISYRRGG